MTVVQNIPNTRITGQQTFAVASTAQAWSNATLVIDRTISGGLNSLAQTDTLGLLVERSTDGGTTWKPVAGITCIGGVWITKGITLATETVGVGVGAVGDGFRITATPSTPVRVAGTFTYE